VKFCGPGSRKRQGQLYLWFAAVSKAQTLTAETSASPTNNRAGSLPATGRFNIELEAKIFDRYLSACGKGGIQYTERGVIANVCNYMCNFFHYFPLHREQFQYADNNIDILIKMQFTT